MLILNRSLAFNSKDLPLTLSFNFFKLYLLKSFKKVYIYFIVQFKDELNETEFEQGVIGMANAGPGTNGSQFYLMLDAAPHLTNRYTAFGKVTEGLEHVLAIADRDPMKATTPGEKMISVTIEEK